jgi:hypothetical protein
MKTMAPPRHVIEKIREMAEVVESDPKSRGVLSTSERVAVALVLRRMDWLQADGFGDLDEAYDRLGEEWTEAVGVVVRMRNVARVRKSVEE